MHKIDANENVGTCSLSIVIFKENGIKNNNSRGNARGVSRIEEGNQRKSIKKARNVTKWNDVVNGLSIMDKLFMDGPKRKYEKIDNYGYSFGMILEL